MTALMDVTALLDVTAEIEAPSTQPHLLALQPAIQPNFLVLDDEAYTLGRAGACAVTAPFPWVSRVHARIEQIGSRFVLRDQGSVNGTFVNGARVVDAYALSHHDVIGLGESGPHLTYVDPDKTQSTATRLTYDERGMRFSIGAADLDLTPNQFRLLRHLHRRRGEVCPREECAEAVWGPSYAPGMDATTLDRLISTLRASLRRVDESNGLIVTRPGLGYQLADSA